MTTHLMIKHKHDANFTAKCKVMACQFETKDWRSFCRHIKKFHNDLAKSADELANVQERDDEPEPEPDKETESEEMKELRSQAMFCLKLETRHKLTKVAIDEVLSHQLQFLHRMGADLQSPMATAITELRSDYKRLSVYKSKFNMIDPVQVDMDTQRYRKAYIVPLKKNLEFILSLPEVYKACFEDPIQPRTDGVLEELADGEYIRGHPVFANSPTNLQLILYTDDFQITNPIGSHCLHKITGFYFTLGNLQCRLRSKWQSAFLVAVAYTCSIRESKGLAKLLEDFITTTKALASEQGLNLTVKGQQRWIRGTIAAVIADQPASSYLGGLKEGVNFSRKPCRTCHISTDEMKTKFEHFDFRSSQQHLDRARRLEEMDGQQRREYSASTGINSYSPLLDIPGVNIPEILVGDNMHNLLCGLIPVQFSLLLEHAIDQGLKLDDINREFRDFRYHYLDSKNKPEKFTLKQIKSRSIKQTAAACLQLVYIAPLILARHADLLGDHYKNFLQLVCLTTYCCAPVSSIDVASEVEVLAETYCKDFISLYPQETFRPKHHYMLHAGRTLINFSAPRNTWAMRMEGKNQMLKAIYARWYCMKNLAFSIASRHQMAMCHHAMTSDGTEPTNFFGSRNSVANGVQIDFAESNPNLLPEFRAKVLSDVTQWADTLVYKTPKIELSSIEYRKDCALCTCIDDNDTPVFIQISELFVYKGRHFCTAFMMETIQYNPEMNAYEVKKTPTEKIFVFSDLSNKWPLPVYSVGALSVVTNRAPTIGTGHIF